MDTQTAYVTVWDSGTNSTTSLYLQIEIPAFVFPGTGRKVTLISYLYGQIYKEVCNSLSDDPGDWGPILNSNPGEGVFVSVYANQKTPGIFRTYSTRFGPAIEPQEEKPASGYSPDPLAVVIAKIFPERKEDPKETQR